MTAKDQIINEAKGILKQSPKGYSYSELVGLICKALPSIPLGTVGTLVSSLDAYTNGEIFKPARGQFMHKKFKVGGPSEEFKDRPVVKETIKESAFYKPFADWIVNELEECTKAIPVGGNIFKDKWGTPDVVGVRESKKSDIIKFPTEIVSAEIKIDTAGLITAFGQACAYRLFSHKSYIVVPIESQVDDISRLDTLCRIFGIGFILFDASSVENPNFQIRVRAGKNEPDMFYVNQCMKFIEDDLF